MNYSQPFGIAVRYCCLDQGVRCIYADDPRAVLSDLIERRYPVYAEADLTIDSGDGPPELTATRTIAALALCPRALTLPDPEAN